MENADYFRGSGMEALKHKILGLDRENFFSKLFSINSY
jgi:hypothetical protein